MLVKCCYGVLDLSSPSLFQCHFRVFAWVPVSDDREQTRVLGGHLGDDEAGDAVKLIKPIALIRRQL
jgi:hypothetical protein